jgi:serine/threonine protein kinase/formylglycine-generating enzyme required for sulfatase activity
MNLWRITITEPSGESRVEEVSPGTLVVGTGTGCAVRVEAADVAPEHAQFWFGGEHLRVLDLGSAAGTVVDGFLLTSKVKAEYPVSVQLGSVKLWVEVWDEQAQTGVAAQEASVEVRMDYGLQEEIARGGMGRIYMGQDPQLKRTVAVKVSTVSYGGEDPRFVKEAKVLASLSHPSIVPIYNIGKENEGHPYYAMKLIKGRTLQAVIKGLSEGHEETIAHYTQKRLLTVFRKVCDAMAFAHSKGILHRDLKPENIMVGEFGEVLVMDWGLAKIRGELEFAARAGIGVAEGDTGVGEERFGMTMEGEVLGTPQYMSPEQASGMAADLDERSDVYALGGILYSILALRPPVGGSTLEEVLSKVKTGAIFPMDPSFREPFDEKKKTERVPEALLAVIRKAMALEREHRYRSVLALAEEIDAYQEGYATRAQAAGFFKRSTLWLGRNKAFAVTVLAVGGMAGALTPKVLREQQQTGAAFARLRETAPTFAAHAENALRDGEFEAALESATYAVELDPQEPTYHRLRADALQVLFLLPEALAAYRRSAALSAEERVFENLRLTEELVAVVQQGSEAEAQTRLYEALKQQKRRGEAMAFGKLLRGALPGQKKDPAALAELVKRLEEKLLPVPGTSVLLASTELTVAEWKLYLAAEGLPNWEKPQAINQTDGHPVVNVTWTEANEFCTWLTANSGREWRLPTNAEWDAAVGRSIWPWGDDYPPKWNEGNYAVDAKGGFDGSRTGEDRIVGTAPVGSFKPNELGFYDLGGNAAEWVLDGTANDGKRVVRGGSWVEFGKVCRSDYQHRVPANRRDPDTGFRMARVSAR